MANDYPEVYEHQQNEIARLRAEVAEAKRLLDPAVVEAARYLVRNADTHPHTCCLKCAEATAALQALADAADARLHEPNWIPLLNARRVLAAGEKA